MFGSTTKTVSRQQEGSSVQQQPDLQHHKPLTVCVEGNIGSGKTTLLQHLATRDGVEVFEEPVHLWTDVQGNNLLDMMYKDPCRWSHLFQTYVQLTMLQQHVKPCSASVKVIERSIYSARHCFVEDLYQTGKMSEAEYKVYCEWYNMITSSSLDVSVDLIVYLSADPTVVLQRIVQRGRMEDTSLAMPYLRQIHAQHQRWLAHGALPGPLLVLDQHMTIEHMCTAIEERVAAILKERQQPTPAATSAEAAATVVPKTVAATAVPKTAKASN